MPAPVDKDEAHTSAITIDEASTVLTHEGEPHSGPRNSKGWDGKLRVPKSAVLANPEALSDPEYSDDDNIMDGEEIQADEDLLDDEDPDTDEIMCAHSRIKSIPSLKLERFQKVVRICLRQNNIQEIEGLAALAATLEDVDLYDNLISHIRGLDELTKLTVLDLSFNKIKHIKNIGHMRDLKTLFLVANKVSKIEGLEGLGNLTSLELGSNRIRELKNLDTLVNLEELWVAKNKIVDITGLDKLSNLRLLSIQSNRISDLGALQTVPSLEELYISHNALTSLEGLQNNLKLRVLDISNNQVSSLAGLGPLKALEELWASYNHIGDFADVEKELKDKKDLTTVYFEGNPLQLRSPALYRNKVRLTLPQVSQIDASKFACNPRALQVHQLTICSLCQGLVGCAAWRYYIDHTISRSLLHLLFLHMVRCQACIYFFGNGGYSYLFGRYILSLYFGRLFLVSSLLLKPETMIGPPVLFSWAVTT